MLTGNFAIRATVPTTMAEPMASVAKSDARSEPTSGSL
jgi:hypothetical protein